MPTYTTWGPVRGCCRHLHATNRQASDCLERDQKSCDAAGGYSDREVRKVEADRGLKPDYQGRVGLRVRGVHA